MSEPDVRNDRRSPRVASRPAPAVVLTAPREADRAAVMALRLASRAFLEPWEATPPDGTSPFGPEWFDRFMASSRTPTSQRFLIRDARDRTIVGGISLSGIVRGPFCSCFVGYWLGEPHTGKGYMTAALRAVLLYAFDDLELHRVEANIMPENATSLALVARVGFWREGLARRFLRINGDWRDHERWAMTAEAWEGAQRAQMVKLPNGR